MALLQAIGEAIGEATGTPFAVRAESQAGGGCIHEARVLGDGGRRYFVKLNQAAAGPMFEAEADGLRALAACRSLRVPQVIALGTAEDRAFLVLEYLSLQPLRERARAQAAGRALAELHRLTGEAFGWSRPNFIGANPQHNQPHGNWPYFFAERRLRPQFAWAAAKGYRGRLAADGERLMENIGSLFLEHRPAPSLLHGDLWHGNAALDDTGRLVLYDPAAYHGDREADLAMSELFGGFPEAFYAAYREAWPLDEGYEQRKTLYNLYHVLNHLNLFGGSYLRQAERMAAGLVAEIGR